METDGFLNEVCLTRTGCTCTKKVACSLSTAARMCKRCELPVQITAVIALLSLAHLALAVQDYEGNGRLRFFHPNQGFSISKERASASDAQLKEVTQHAYRKGIRNQPGGPAWNTWQTLPSPRRRTRQHPCISTVPSREGQRLRPSRCGQSGQSQVRSRPPTQ